MNNITSSRHIDTKVSYPISISEFLEKGLVLNLPPLTCSQGHQLMLDIHLHDGTEKILIFNTTAKIIEMETSVSEIVRVTVKFVQYDPFIWKKFQRLYLDCQNDLQTLLSSLKGSAK